jgi:hypothetical protein
VQGGGGGLSELTLLVMMGVCLVVCSMLTRALFEGGEGAAAQVLGSGCRLCAAQLKPRARVPGLLLLPLCKWQ